MSENTSNTNVTGDNISDDKFNQFFESGGNVELEGNDANESQQDNQDQTDTTKNQTASIQENQNTTSQEAGKQDDKQAEHERNYKAMAHEERERRKEIQQQLSAHQQQMVQMQNVLTRILDKANQQQQPQALDFNADPIGVLKQNQEALAQELERQRHIENTRLQHETRNAQLEQFDNQYKLSAMEFVQQQKDFTDAYQYLRNSRIQEFQAAGFTLKEANNLFIDDERAIAAKAFQDGINPAERLYNLSKMRGYNAQSANNTHDKTTSNDKKIENLQKGMQASKSLNGNGGQREKAPVTLESLMQMQNDELDDYLANTKNWNSILKMG